MFRSPAAVAAALLFTTAAVHAAPIIDLASASYMTFGNGNSYSLPLNGISVKSSPGIIKDEVIVYTGAGGVPVTTNVAGFDDAYGSPNGTKTYASINGAINVDDPGNKAGIANNDANTWDASLLALKTFLDGGTPLFLFNNNDTAEDQTLAVWAKLWLTDAAGGLVNGRYLYLSNAGAAYGAGGTLGGDATLYNPGNITSPTTGYASTDFVAAGGEVMGVDHNLGANEVAYAVDAPLLNAWLDGLFALPDATLSQYTLHLDLRLGCISTTAWGGSCDEVKIDNGYEQLFIVANDRALAPEPGAIGLAGLALIGAGWAARRRRR